MSKIALAFFLFTFSTSIFSQPVWDSTSTLSRHEAGFAKYRPTTRIGVGYNQTEQLDAFMDLELGLNFTRIHQVWLLSNTSNAYISLGYAPKQQFVPQPVYSVKTGYEVVFRYIGWGAELKTSTNWKSTAFYFIPKAGISYFGKISLYYHYGLALTNNRFSSQFTNQFSLQFNFAKKMKSSFTSGD